MSLEQRYPVMLVCCGSFNPVTTGHIKMFEIARSFLERTGNHIVISGTMSPVHDNYGKGGLISSKHRISMCKAAIKDYSWLNVDTWECTQDDWVKTAKVLQRMANKIKNDYGMPGPYSQPIDYTPSIHQRNTVTLQPNGSLKHHLFNDRFNSIHQRNDNVFCSSYTKAQEDSWELNEASEPDRTGVALIHLSKNLKKVCCVRPVPFPLSDNMVYGATFDLRRTKVMLLCGSDFLESFGVSGLWSDEDIEEIVTDYGIVCIPRNIEGQTNDGGKLLRDALNRLQKILARVQGSIILVNDQSRVEIARVSSTKCRSAFKSGEFESARNFLNPHVYNYIQDNRLYIGPECSCG